MAILGSQQPAPPSSSAIPTVGGTSQFITQKPARMDEDLDENADSEDDSSVIGTLHMEVTDEDWDPLQYAKVGRQTCSPIRPILPAAPLAAKLDKKLGGTVEIKDKKFGTWHKRPRRRRASKRRPVKTAQTSSPPQVAPLRTGRHRKQWGWQPEALLEATPDPAEGVKLEPVTSSPLRRQRRQLTTPEPPSPPAPLVVRRPERTYSRRRQAPRLVAPQYGVVAEAGLGPTLEASGERHSLAFCFPSPHKFDFEAEQALVQLSLNAETAKEQALQRTKYRRAYRYRLMHPTPDATQCEHCGGFYNTRPNFHMYSCPALHRKVPCPDCGRVFATSRTLRSHQVIHTRSMMKTHPCLLCGKLYASKKGVSRHMSDMHQDVMKHHHQCTVCHRRFSEESGLLKHVKVHEGREPLRCPGCDKHFTYPSNMKYHKCRGKPS